MASTTATPVITSNPGSASPNVLRFTVNYTSGSSSDTCKVQGLRSTNDTVIVQTKAVSVYGNFAGITEAKANRSIANKTINLVPVNAAPTTAIACEITIIRV